MRPTVFIPEYMASCGIDMLKAECDCIIPWEHGAQLMDIPQGDHPLRAPLYEADAVIVRVINITAQDLERPNRLKVIVKHGVGIDNIDCQAAADHGIPVAYTPTGNTNAVAEHTLALILALMRRLEPAGEALRQGRFSERNDFLGDELSEKTLGIIGLGRIGSRVAKKAAGGLEMTVLAYDPYVSPEVYTGPATLVDSLETLLHTSDIITLHVPLTTETKHIINAQTLQLMKPGCRIINTSRGPVVDQDALLSALQSGTIAGAGLDVFEDEPLPANHPLCDAPNIVLTPHIAGLTNTSMERTATLAAQAVLDALHGRTPDDVVNGVKVEG